MKIYKTKMILLHKEELRIMIHLEIFLDAIIIIN